MAKDGSNDNSAAVLVASIAALGTVVAAMANAKVWPFDARPSSPPTSMPSADPTPTPGAGPSASPIPIDVPTPPASSASPTAPPDFSPSRFTDAQLTVAGSSDNEAGAVLIRNYCDKDVTIALDVWTNGTSSPASVFSWIYKAGQISRPTVNDHSLNTTDGSVRYYARTENYSLQWSGNDKIYYNNVVYPMKLYPMGKDEQGRYLLDLTCA